MKKVSSPRPSFKNFSTERGDFCLCRFMVKKLYYYLTRSPEREAVRFGCAADAREMRRALRKYGMYYEEFCLFDCAGKTDGYVSSFITERNRFEIYRKYNDPRDVPLFHDKWRVYQVYREYYKREVCPVISSRDRMGFLEFAARHPIFLVKPADKSCGYGVKIADTSVQPAEELFGCLRKAGKYVCEELVPPHPVTERLNPTSLNTVRIVTVLEDGRVRLFHPFLRVGRYGSIVDNGGAGGIIVPVDAETGRLSKTGRDETGRYYSEHPDSRVRFADVTLPMWDEAVRLAETLAKIHPTSRCIGFDLAAAETGWLMIEANIHGQFIGQQMVDRVGRRWELIGEKTF